MNIYPIAHIIHLYCAITFVGGVIFEVFILSALHAKTISHQAKNEVKPVIAKRTVLIMPWVVAVLFLSGFTMVYRYIDILRYPLASAFGVQLSFKILLAISILIHFLITLTKIRRKTVTVAWIKYIHTAVLIQMIIIVFLAKSMFYFNF